MFPIDSTDEGEDHRFFSSFTIGSNEGIRKRYRTSESRSPALCSRSPSLQDSEPCMVYFSLSRSGIDTFDGDKANVYYNSSKSDMATLAMERL